MRQRPLARMPIRIACRSCNHRLLEWAIFTPADVSAFAQVWYRAKRRHSVSDHRVMNAVIDAVVHRFQGREEEEREEFRGPVESISKPLRLPVADHSLSGQRT